MKYLLYTNYTYAVLDLGQDILEGGEVQIIPNHPGKTLKDKSLQAASWFDNLKLSQQKYIKDQPIPVQSEDNSNEKVSNLIISNKIKGILAMEYNTESKKLQVVENMWKKIIEQFPDTVAIAKYG